MPMSAFRIVVLRDRVIKIQAGTLAAYGGDERHTARNNRRLVANQSPHPNVIYMNVGCYI